MKSHLDNLSQKEIKLYKDTISLNGTMEELVQKLIDKGTFDNYKAIHNDYFDLLSTTYDNGIKLEALKRLTFLNWYSILEPSFLTGINNLDDKIIFNSYSVLDYYIKANKLDKELIWMLSYYSSWDWIILTYSTNKLESLTKFVKNVDTSILHIPKNQLPEGSMDNRGQMGIYWKSCSVENNVHN